MTWAQAAATADALGPSTELVTIRNTAENDWISMNVTNAAAWIGLTDEAQEGVWLWRSGEPFVFSSWAQGQPDNGYFGEDYAGTNNGTGQPGKWFDQADTDTQKAIFEFISVDADNDGLLDVDEISIYSTDPGLFDTDGDGLGDGQELGVTYASAPADTNQAVFAEDADPLTTTDPLVYDTDGGGTSDGNEDVNKNGRVDVNEGDPNASADDLFQLSVLGLSPGQQATISVWDAHPGSTVIPAFSAQGQGPRVFPEYQQLEVALTVPITKLNGMLVGPNGTAFNLIWVPPFVSIGRTIYFQAIEIAPGGGGYRPSIPVITTVL